ncbi:hypothetical protein EZV62_019727 [Acer yangbiense]|uniref:Chromophore lyase CRL, chloroplastic n=1 Tax=Acer yangbiense TaxID=1000413 RepID=A0A5C7HC25_9ROSI|nr:hypothetical protein EZV62_019727 [Acer yangbiense]
MFTREQASRDPDNFFNIRMLTCPAAEMVDGSKVLYFEQAFWRTPQKPFRQRIYMVKPCPKELKCDVEVGFHSDLWCSYKACKKAAIRSLRAAERRGYGGWVSSYAIREVEEYKNFCDRPKDQRPLPDEVIGVRLLIMLNVSVSLSKYVVGTGVLIYVVQHRTLRTDIGEHLTTIHLKRCERGKRCLYEGSTPPGGFPNSWTGATYCTSELAVLKNNEIHTWDRGYDDDGNQVWGVKEGPYEFKPAPMSSFNDTFSLNFPPPQTMEKRIEGSFVLQE